MGRHARKAQKQEDQAAIRDPGRGPRRPVPPPEPASSASFPVGNALPIQRHEAFPDQWPALPEGSRHEWLEVPAQAQWWEGDQQDCVQFSITDGDGRQKTYSLTGVRRASKALNSSIWSCGLVVVLAAVSFAAIISILAQHSTQQKVIWGLASAAVTGVVWIGSKVRRGLKEHSKRRRKRRSKALADDTGPG